MSGIFSEYREHSHYRPDALRDDFRYWQLGPMAIPWRIAGIYNFNF
jgi:hypothetical protein